MNSAGKMFAGLCVLLFAAPSLRFVNGGSANKSIHDSSAIIYPGPMKPVTNRYGTDTDNVTADVPEACRGKRFCTIKPPNYPQERFNEMFKGYKPIAQPSLVLEDDLNRQGDDSSNGCETLVTYEPLYQVRSQAGDWRTVVQAPDENYVQRVRLEECASSKASCFDIFPDQPGVEKFCKQTYNVWEVLVAPGQGRSEPEKIKTELPVCCSCHYRID